MATVIKTTVNCLEEGDQIAQHDDGLVFPDDYDFEGCEWRTVTQVIQRYADLMVFVLDGEDEFSVDAGQVVLRKGRCE